MVRPSRLPSWTYSRTARSRSRMNTWTTPSGSPRFRPHPQWVSFKSALTVDDTAHIIVAAEPINSASDVRELPTMVAAVKDTLGAYPEQTLADAGYRSEAVFAALAGCTDLIVAIGREGKGHRAINEATLPLTAAMVAKMKTQEARNAYRRRKWLAEPPNGWIKNVLGFRQFSLRGLHRVSAEWKLVCLALNLRQMASMRAA